MVTKSDKLKWMLYCKKREILLMYGLATGLIHTYEKDFINNLRHVYYGGVPGSIILLSRGLCNHYCYDRALLATFGMDNDDFRLVDADVDKIALHPSAIENFRGRDEHYGNHCFVERTKKDGSIWVYDTTDGLVYEKNLYYLIERPKITVINDKKSVQNYIEYQEIKNADIEKDKYALPIIIPNIDIIASREIQYKDALIREIELFKKEIDYNGICEDMKVKGFRK